MSVTLYEHQKDDVKAMADRPYYALWHEVGAGKTFPLIYMMLQNLMLNPKGMWVIVAEAGNLLEQWKEEIELCNEEIVDLTVTVLSGRSKKHVKDSVKYRPPDILLINYEYFPKLELWLRQHAVTGKIKGMIFDEAHRLKGFRGLRSRKYGKRARSIVNVAHARLGRPDDIIRYMASGSPVVNPNSPDIWGLYYMMNPEIMGKTLWRFEQEFFYDVAVGQPYKKLMLKPTMKKELSRRMYSCARRLLVDELPVDFPHDTWMEYPVTMPPKLLKLYNELQKEAITQVDDKEISRPDILARLMSLQQMAGGFLIEKSVTPSDPFDLNFDDPGGGIPTRTVLHIDSSHKDRQLIRIMDEIGWRTSVTVWAHFKHELEHINKILINGGALTAPVYGDIPGVLKVRNVADFKTGKATALVGQPASCGAGLNLQMAGHSIRYGRSHRLLDFIQSAGRIKRPNSKHGRIVYHEIFVANSSDQRCYEALREKRSLSAELTLDHIKEMRA